MSRIVGLIQPLAIPALLFFGSLASAETFLVPIDGSDPNFKADQFGYRVTVQEIDSKSRFRIELDEAATRSFRSAVLSLRGTDMEVLRSNLGIVRDKAKGFLEFEFDRKMIEDGKLTIHSQPIKGRPAVKDFGGFTLSLDELRFQEKLARAGGTDRYGVPVPAGAVVRLGVSAIGEPAQGYYGIAYSQDGKWFVAVDHSGNPRLWNLANGRLVRKWNDPATRHASTDRRLFGKRTFGLVAFSPDGKRLLAGWEQGPFRLRDVVGDRRIDMEESEFPHFSQAVSADFTTLAGLTVEYQVQIWKVASGKKVARWDVPGKPEVLALAADGKTVATGDGNGLIRLWNTEKGVEVSTLKDGHLMPVSALAFSPDGKSLASGDKDMRIVLWDLSDKVKPRAWRMEPRDKFETYGVGCLHFSADGNTLGSTGYIRHCVLDLWDVRTLKHLQRIRDYGYPPQLFAFSPDSKTVATCGSWHIHFWDTATGQMTPGGGHLHCPDSLAFSADSKTVASVAGCVETILWDAINGKELRRLEPSTYPRTLSGDGRLVADWNDEGESRIEEVSTGKRLFTLKTDHSRSQVLSPNGKLLVVPTEKGVAVWDLTQGRKKFHLPESIQQFNHQALSPDGNLLAATERLSRFDEEPGRVSITLWDLRTGNKVRDFEGRSLYRLLFSPSGDTLLVLGYKELALYEVASGEKRLARSITYYPDAVFSPDGRVLALATPKGLVLWDTFTWQELYHFQEHPGGVHGLAFSHDGKRLAAGCDDSSILLWDMTRVPLPKKETVMLSLSKVQDFWQDLGGNAEKAHKAMHSLTCAPRQTLDFLTAKTPDLSPQSLKRWLAQLDDQKFSAREKATQELLEQGVGAVLVLERLQQDTRLSLEARRRIERILQKLDKQKLIWRRATEVLESLNTVEARKLLSRLAEGDGEIADRARSGLATLERLSRSP
jgi:WD40 repeat protein